MGGLLHAIYHAYFFKERLRSPLHSPSPLADLQLATNTFILRKNTKFPHPHEITPKNEQKNEIKKSKSKIKIKKLNQKNENQEMKITN